MDDEQLLKGQKMEARVQADEEIEALCASMMETARGIRDKLDSLDEGNQRAYWKETRANALQLLEMLTSMRLEQGRAAFALLPELCAFEDLTPAQMRQGVELLRS